LNAHQLIMIAASFEHLCSRTFYYRTHEIDLALITRHARPQVTDNFINIPHYYRRNVVLLMMHSRKIQLERRGILI